MGHFYSLLVSANIVHRIITPNALRASHRPFSCSFKCPNCLPKPSRVESSQSFLHADVGAVDIQLPCPSSASCTTPQRYDQKDCEMSRRHNPWPHVFLSHSGKEKNFARHLYKEMQRESISCFFDENPQSLRVGEEFPRHIFEAAMNCKVAVVVLSEEFISTKWPMQELCTFVKAQNTGNMSLKILPLFFAISPESLAQKLQKRDFLKTWQKLLNSQWRSIDFDEWIKALEALRRHKGVKYFQCEGEVAYIEKIVSHIRDILPPNIRSEDSDVQGKERMCQEVAKLFETSPCRKNGVTMAGLYGVGGIGKTTIAKNLCNFYSNHFNGRVLHVELGREDSVTTLKRALRVLSDASEYLVNSVISIEHGWYLLQERMHAKNVFLALDNISDHAECTEEVRMYLKAVCHGNESIILLTSRSLAVLNRFVPEESSCMHVPSLQETEAISVLLKLTPLQLSNLTSEQMVIARKCVQKCCFARRYCRVSSDYPQYHPLALQIFGAFLYDKFQYSWADLSRWIDIPNHSLRDQIHEVFGIFEGSFTSLSVQHRMIFMLLSLYLPKSDMTLRKIINWLALVCDKGVEDIESAIIELKRKGFIESTKELHSGLYIHDLLIAFAEREADGTGKWILVKGKDEIPSDLQQALSNDRPRISAMRFENCHFESHGMANNKLFTDILVLHLKDMHTLKILDLNSMKIVRSIVINGCSGLQEIHGLGSLTSLAYFRIEGCSAYVQLFCPRIQCLKALRHLEIHANFQETTTRSLQGPWSWFPPLQHISNLKTIHLDRFEKGPGSLHLIGCSKLRVIELSHCDITVLDLTGCLELRTISVSFCCNLSEIRLFSPECSTVNLLRRPVCPNLNSLHLQGMNSLRELPNLSGLTRLSTFRMSKMTSLRELPSLSGSTPLTTLWLLRMSILTKLPSLSELPRLTRLVLAGMDNLRELPSLSGLPHLAILWLEGLGSLKELPSLSELPCLNGLLLARMDNLRELPSLGELPHLTKLYLGRIDNWRVLPNLGGLPRLIRLHLRKMNNLTDLSSLTGLPSLTQLYLTGMDNLREFPTLTGLPRLTSLHLTEMYNLRELPSLNGLPRLTNLYLMEMDNLRELPSLSELSRLTNLFLGEMDNLRELPNLSGLTNLTTLHLTEMHNMKEIPNLSGLSNLRDVRLTKCMMIPELAGLKMAVIEECGRLTRCAHSEMTCLMR